jgi:hypothetical protein
VSLCVCYGFPSENQGLSGDVMGQVANGSSREMWVGVASRAYFMF